MASAKPAVIGIDLGAADSYVSFVGKGVVDIVQNEVSKRATPTLVGFTSRERLLGDSALAQIKSNAKNTCRNFKHLLGRKVDAPDLEIEHFWSTSRLCSTDDGLTGYEVTYKDEPKDVSATQVTAMYITKLKEITEKWCQAKVSDAVISVPGCFSDVQRQAVLDACQIANLSVLRVMNEHTATALAYGIYRSNDFDEATPQTVAFCSMGHSMFSVSFVQFVRGKLTVLCERSDKVGGRDMDECLMREFAAQFKKKTGCDPLTNKKAAFKLEDAVTKTKKILSANNEAPVTVECLMEDEDFASMMTRADFEAMCEPMMGRVRKVLEEAKAASGVPITDVSFVEIVGGGSRVPWVKNMIKEAFGGHDLSTTMNQEESVARGCALQAAILSPLFKVRDFKIEESTPNGVEVGWVGSSADAGAAKEEDGDVAMAAADGEQKCASVFPAGSQLNTAKMLTFYRKAPFDIKAKFNEAARLLPGTTSELGDYRIEMPVSAEPKKVKVKAKLTLHGTFAIEGATMVEEEEYQETIKEKREVPPEETGGDAAEASPAPEETGAEANPEGDETMKDGEKTEKTEEKKEETPKVPEKKYEWVDVVKTKRRTRRTDVPIVATGKPGLSDDVIQKRKDEETAMIVDMNEIIETDERRNDLEAYIFNMRDKVREDGGEYAEFISSEARDSFLNELTAAEDWLYDTYDATKIQYIEKLDGLKSTGDPVAWRYKEAGMRQEWVNAVVETVKNFRQAATNPGDTYGHIAADKLAKVATACNELEAWLNEKQAAQATLQKSVRPALMCADMEKKTLELKNMADAILREPRPAPPKEEKEQTNGDSKEPADTSAAGAAGDAGAGEEQQASSPDAGEGAAEKMEVDG